MIIPALVVGIGISYLLWLYLFHIIRESNSNVSYEEYECEEYYEPQYDELDIPDFLK